LVPINADVVAPGGSNHRHPAAEAG